MELEAARQNVKRRQGRIAAVLTACLHLYPLADQGTALDLGRIPVLWSKMDKHGVQNDLHCGVQFRTRDLAGELTFY